MPSGKSEKGFTLLMVLLAVVVMGMATLTAVESWTTSLAREREEEFVFRIQTVRRGIAAYREQKGRFPPAFASLETGLYVRAAMFMDPITRTTWTPVASPQGGIETVKSASTAKMWRVAEDDGRALTYEEF